MDDVESDLRSISIKKRINALGRTEWPCVTGKSGTNSKSQSGKEEEKKSFFFSVF